MASNINELIEQIRKEEREKILREIEEKEVQVKPFTEVSRYINCWGEEANVPIRDLYKIKEAVYTIIRQALGIKRIPDLREEQIPIAEEIASDVLEIIKQAN